MPVPFPELACSASPGDHVLAPPRAWVDAAAHGGLATQSFLYFAARLGTAGPKSSWIVTSDGIEEELPNALIIAIRPHQKALPGTLVLTDWAGGSGMQRAWVVEGGTPLSPRVRFLDLPESRAEHSVELKPDSFHPLTVPGEVGTTVACQEGANRVRYTVVARADQQILGLGFAGKLAALPLAQCRALPLTFKRDEGATVIAPRLGVYLTGKIHKVDEDSGRVQVRFPIGHGEEELSIPFGTLALARDFQETASEGSPKPAVVPTVTAPVSNGPVSNGPAATGPAATEQ